MQPDYNMTTNVPKFRTSDYRTRPLHNVAVPRLRIPGPMKPKVEDYISELLELLEAFFCKNSLIMILTTLDYWDRTGTAATEKRYEVKLVRKLYMRGDNALDYFVS